MSEHDNGGPAFPLAHNVAPPQGSVRAINVHTGMTLRDYFAAKALAALICAEKDACNRGAKAVPTLARWSYEYADAMLAERAKRGAK